MRPDFSPGLNPASMQRFFLNVRSPHLFDVVELADFWTKHVDNDIACVDEHPVSSLKAFNTRTAETLILHIGNEMFADRRDMPARSPGHDYHVVCQRRLPGYVQGNDIFCLRVLDTRENGFKSTAGGIDAALLALRDSAESSSLGVYCCQRFSFPK